MDYSTGDVDTEHGLHLSQHPHQYNTPQSANGAPFATPFRHLDHNMDSSASRNMHPSASPHLLAHDGNGNVHQGQVHQSYYSDSRNAIATPSTPSQSASPRFSALSPGQNRQMYQSFVPQDRSLPDREVTDESLDNAYVEFVLYCNPSFPTSVDTAELRKVFRSPPKSDGKTFSTFTLFELIRKLDSKEIKTWTELALELGVEKPTVEKGQSSQKVQQYSVRLKVSLILYFSLSSYNPQHSRLLKPSYCAFSQLIELTYHIRPLFNVITPTNHGKAVSCSCAMSHNALLLDSLFVPSLLCVP
jgi:hypothetical protein